MGDDRQQLKETTQKLLASIVLTGNDLSEARRESIAVALCELAAVADQMPKEACWLVAKELAALGYPRFAEKWGVEAEVWPGV